MALAVHPEAGHEHHLTTLWRVLRDAARWRALVLMVAG